MDAIIWNAMLPQFRIQFVGTEGGVYSCMKKAPNVQCGYWGRPLTVDRHDCLDEITFADAA